VPSPSADIRPKSGGGSEMSNGDHPGENKTTTADDESLQSEFVQEKLVESKTDRPRMRLRDVHIRLEHRFFSCG